MAWTNHNSLEVRADHANRLGNRSGLAEIRRGPLACRLMSEPAVANGAIPARTQPPPPVCEAETVRATPSRDHRHVCGILVRRHSSYSLDAFSRIIRKGPLRSQARSGLKPTQGIADVETKRWRQGVLISPRKLRHCSHAKPSAAHHDNALPRSGTRAGCRLAEGRPSLRFVLCRRPLGACICGGARTVTGPVA